MKHHPSTITEVASHFDGLPGVGPRAALRYAYWLVNQPKERLHAFARAVEMLAESVHACPECGSLTDQDRCSICSDSSRERTLLCVVATNQDLRVIEESGAFHGIYHVLGGLIDPIEGHTPERLLFPQLIERLRDPSHHIQEIILGFDPDMRGDTTALYLEQLLKKHTIPCPTTRFARGLPNGAQIEYADGTTVADALRNRRGMSRGTQ